MTAEQPKEDFKILEGEIASKKEALEMLKLRAKLYQTFDEGFGKRLANN